MHCDLYRHMVYQRISIPSREEFHRGKYKLHHREMSWSTIPYLAIDPVVYPIWSQMILNYPLLRFSVVCCDSKVSRLSRVALLRARRLFGAMGCLEIKFKNYFLTFVLPFLFGIEEVFFGLVEPAKMSPSPFGLLFIERVEIFLVIFAGSLTITRRECFIPSKILN